MKKRRTAVLLCAVMLFALSVTAAAAEEPESGFYGIGTAERVEIVPLTADGEAASGVVRDGDGNSVPTLFYPDSRALRVTVSDTVPGMMYLLTVSSGDTVLYAGQQTGTASVSFNVSFSLPEQREDLLLNIGSNAPGFAKISVPLSYTPAAASENTAPDDGSCPRDESCPMAEYSDLDRGAWYHDGVHYALERGVMNGVGGGCFDPTGTASRAMIVTMLHRMEGAPECDGEMTFADVPEGKWYTAAVRWASSAHIVDGYSADRFGPEESVSREQLATILWRYAKYKGIGEASGERTGLGVFLDAEKVSRWAREGMQWAVDAGVITGVGNEKLSPGTSATRAQVATMLMRFGGIL